MVRFTLTVSVLLVTAGMSYSQGHHTPKPLPAPKVELLKPYQVHLPKGGIPHPGKDKKTGTLPVMSTTVNPALLPDNEDYTREYGLFVVKHNGVTVKVMPSWGTVPRHRVWCLAGDTQSILEVYHNGALIEVIRPGFIPQHVKELKR
jgi:hypothetical protein